MDLNGYAHVLPEVAFQELSRRGVSEVQLADGVSRLAIAGHDQGVGYRFYIHPIYNKEKSEEAGYEVFDEVEMIEWRVDRKNKPVEQVQFLPAGLLKFRVRDKVTGLWDVTSECIGGRYREAYEAFKSGKATPGMPLARWGVLSDAEMASLAAEGIFTVEQFAAMPKERIRLRFPDNFAEAQERAVHFVAGKEMREKAGEQAEKMKALEDQNKELLERLSRLEAAQAAPKAGGKQSKFSIEE